MSQKTKTKIQTKKPDQSPPIGKNNHSNTKRAGKVWGYRRATVCTMGTNGGSEMCVYNGKAGVAMWFADDGSLWSCGDAVGRLGSSLAVRGLCQLCTRGFRGTAPSWSHHCARSGPSISVHLHPYPRGLRRSRVLPSSFQPPSLAFPSFVPPPPAPGASPIGVASAKTNTASTTTFRSLQGAGPAPLADSEPRSQLFWVSTATRAHVAAAGE